MLIPALEQTDCLLESLLPSHSVESTEDQVSPSLDPFSSALIHRNTFYPGTPVAIPDRVWDGWSDFPSSLPLLSLHSHPWPDGDNLFTDAFLHLTSIHWRLQLLVQTHDSPIPFMPVSADNSLLTTTYLQSLIFTPHSLGTLPLGRNRIPLALSWSLSQLFLLTISISLCYPLACRSTLYRSIHSHHIQQRSRNRTPTQKRQGQISLLKIISIIPISDV